MIPSLAKFLQDDELGETIEFLFIDNIENYLTIYSSITDALEILGHNQVNMTDLLSLSLKDVKQDFFTNYKLINLIGLSNLENTNIEKIFKLINLDCTAKPLKSSFRLILSTRDLNTIKYSETWQFRTKSTFIEYEHLLQEVQICKEKQFLDKTTKLYTSSPDPLGQSNQANKSELKDKTFKI